MTPPPANESPTASDSSGTPQAIRVCRFCLGNEGEDDDIQGDFVQPCPCRGSGKFVHLGCLVAHWKARGEEHNFKCPTCRQLYEGKALRELAELSCARMIKEHGEHALLVAHSLCYLAQAQSQLGNARESKELLERSLAIEELHFGADHVATAATLAELASAHGKLGNVQRQKQLLERSLQIKEQHFGAGHISTAVTLNNLATAHSELGDVLQERELLERSLAIKETHFGKGHVQSAATLVNLAGVYSELGDTQRGRELLRHSLAIEEQHFGPGHVETAITLNNLALACGETGDVAGMRQLLEQSLSIKERHFGADHLESCLTLANLGMACGVMGDENLARDYSGRALSACGGQGSPTSRRRGVVLLRAAAVHCALDEVSVGEGFATEALSMLGEVLGPTAGARVLALERTRTSRIWSAAGRTDVVSWLDCTWASENLVTKKPKNPNMNDFGMDQISVSTDPTDDAQTHTTVSSL